MSSLLTLLLCVLPSFTWAQTPKAATPPPVAATTEKQWSWLKGEEAETFLLKKNFALKSGIDGFAVLDQYIGFRFEGSEPPIKTIRFEVEHLLHSDAEPIRLHVFYLIVIEDFDIKMMSFYGKLKGISVGKSGESFIYFEMENAFLVPSTGLTAKATATIQCGYCDNSKWLFSNAVDALKTSLYDRKNQFVLVLPKDWKAHEIVLKMAN
jgi:hypothetical protein